ncbi:MAG: cation-translocating P-type ATPase [Crocinitomicaceae bacterium]|jgi:Ca2+-transporting ATPase
MMQSNSTHSNNPYEVSELVIHRENGRNKLDFKKQHPIIDALKRIFSDPMILLLLIAATIFFVNKQYEDGFFLIVAIVLIMTISLYQFSKSKNALEKLKEFSEPLSKILVDNKIHPIKSESLEVGDLLVVEEGILIAADGIIVHSNDFSVNESILTGESLVVYKDKDKEIYSGTTVSSGLAIVRVTAIGNDTKLGKIGLSLEGITEEKTPLELKISNFVKGMAAIGVVVFVLVWILNYLKSKLFLQSLLHSLTLAMSILPEEISVAFTTFMALGAWRLMQKGVVVKQMKTVETLGSATVICTDKTGTITENKMTLAKLYFLESNSLHSPESITNSPCFEVLEFAMWASESIPFDPMELAIHRAYKNQTTQDIRSRFSLVHEYPLSGTPPMMTHIYKDKVGASIVAIKGAPEALFACAQLTEVEHQQLNEAVKQLAGEGYRVLAVGKSSFNGEEYPESQFDFSIQILGLVAFYDPPKKNFHEVLNHFYKAGIKVKIITGDNVLTTMSIAKQVGFKDADKTISGDELMKLSEVELKKCVEETTIFTRMYPEAKLKIINALKSNNEVVAMTGDGVNDGPALKAAHIGIAMGHKGTEIAKQAASLTLLEDDLSKMVDAIAMGRKIYSNLKKAIQYIISIHIPIVLIVFIPLVLGWIYPHLFSPIHVIFLEIIMGPTCSIIYENEPLEKDAMLQKPKPLTKTFFDWNELSLSIFQGLIISLGALIMYYLSVEIGHRESLTRTMVFVVLITANIFLTLVNRSFYFSILTTLKYKNKLVVWVILTTLFLLLLTIYIKPVSIFFEFESLSLIQFGIATFVGFVSVMWFEVFKFMKRSI